MVHLNEAPRLLYLPKNHKQQRHHNLLSENLRITNYLSDDGVIDIVKDVVDKIRD
jgi:hypothetical protein